MLVHKLHHLTRLLLVLSLVLSTQSLVMVQVAFQLRQDVIVEKFCVNRDRPEMQCDGHCQLSKMMQKAQDREDERRAAMLELFFSFSLWLAPAPKAPPVEAETKAWPSYAKANPPSGAPHGIFRPPRQG